MSFLNRIEKAKQMLLATDKPSTMFELKYGNITGAKKAWDVFFKHFIIRLNGIKARAATADVTDLLTSKQKIFLNEIYDFLDDTVIDMSTTITEFVALMRKYQDNDAFQQALSENCVDLIDAVNSLKQKAKTYVHRAQQEKVLHTQKYKQYEKYLNEILTLNANSIIEGFLNNKMPLEQFDNEFLNETE